MRNKNLLFKIPGHSDITIVVAFPFFWSDSSIKLYHGIRDAAEKYRINLLTIQGYYYSRSNDQKLPEPSFEEPGNIVYKLVSRHTVDGLIMVTRGLKCHSDKLDFIRHCKVFDPIPSISIGLEIENVPKIVIDSTNAVKMIMRHLIEVHDKRRIAFICGPHDNTDSFERLEAYRSSLSDYGIEYSDLLISSNDVYNRDLAYAATLELMALNNNTIDAILCVNDHDANGAIAALRSLNISVPDDVAVIGFNNDYIAEATTPSITSIDQNLYGRGQLAIKILSDHINGIHLSSDYKVDAPVIIRQSCGCLSRAAKAVETAFITRRDSPVKTSDVIDRTAIRDQLKERVFETLNAPRNDKSLSWCNTFVDTFITAIADTSKNDFLRVFNEIIHQYGNSGFDITHWHDALSVLDLSLDYFTDSESVTDNRALILKARIHLSETNEQIQKSSLLRMETQNAAINALNHSFNTTIELNRILDLLVCDLPKIGIQSCYLVLYEDSGKPLEHSKLMLAYNRTGRLTIPPGGVRFNSTQILPEEFIPLSQHKSLILEPLFYGFNQIGFILFELGRKDSGFYELFPAELSAALWSSRLKSTVDKNESILRSQSDEIAKFNEALQERASELEFAFQQIERNQDKLIVAEKMASLGRLTAGIAHEINTPLATIRASLGELDHLVNELSQSIDDPDIVSEDFNQIFTDMLRAVDLSEKSVHNAVSYIKSIQEQTGNKNGQKISDFDLLAVIDSVTRFLNHSIKQSLCKVQINTSPEPVIIRGSSEKMIQVFTNLLTNAIDALEYSDIRLITISLHIENNDLTVSITDTGCGINEESMKKIFQPLFTTKSFGRGTGLGLPIVQKIITEDFNGRISVTSEPGRGTTFYLHLKTI
jgi:signal transduction histidine kinase/DNA-binding LacI/PurR family transcriptional regulator